MAERKKKISLSCVYMDDKIKQSVLKVLDSGHYILGEECMAFEEEFAQFIGTKYAVLTGSGTAAIWLSLISLGVEPQDEIIVPSHTAFPTIEPILSLKAKPVFVDIDSTYTIDPSQIEEKITSKTKGIIPVHLYGHPADMGRIMKVAHKHKLFVLEDSCQSHGAKFKNKTVGSIGEAGCFSFYPSKNLTVCGDGGAVVTNNAHINDKIRMLRDHGRVSKYIHKISGYNERFNEIQATIGRFGLKKLVAFNSRRREIAARYIKNLKGLPIILPQQQEWAYHVWHMFVIRVKNRDEVRDYLSRKGIETGIHYPLPCHLQPAILKTKRRIKLVLTEKWCKEILSLPIYPFLSDKKVDYICQQVEDSIQQKAI